MRRTATPSTTRRRSPFRWRSAFAWRAARPNWLPSGDDTDRNLMLMLRIYAPRDTDSLGVGLIPADLPRSSASYAVRIPGLYIVLGSFSPGCPYRCRAHAADARAANAQARLASLAPSTP